MTQKKLEQLLTDPPAAQTPIQRGKPLGLSTDEGDSAQSHNRTIAPTQQKAPGPKRTKRGYALRDDLVKACKQIALDNDRLLYEVMEEAIEQYLERQKRGQPVTPAPVEQPAPDILISLREFADLHGVNRNEAERQRSTGMIAGIKQGAGRQAIVMLGAKGRHDFWVQFHNTPGFLACDGCPHEVN